MTLEQKFLPYCDHEYGNREDNAANCAEEANEYAIDFALWVIKGNISILERYPTEALEIYKKENKL